MDGDIGVEHYAVEQVVLQRQGEEVEDDGHNEQSPESIEGTADYIILSVSD